MDLSKFRQTKPDTYAGVVRVLLGIIFLMTGLMKITLPKYGNSWSIQLIEANIPFYEINLWFVPLFEILLGIVLLLGVFSRIAALMILPVMFVATYVHITVTNPEAFPSQPQEPYIPVVVIILSLFILKKGGGKWSLDLKSMSNP